MRAILTSLAQAHSRGGRARAKPRGRILHSHRGHFSDMEVERMRIIRRLVLIAVIAAALAAPAYGFWWWRVQEMDSQRCAASIQAMAEANEPGALYGPVKRGELSWDERKYTESYTLVAWIGNELVARYC